MPVHVVGRTQSPHPLGNQKRWPVQIKSDVGGANGYDEDELDERYNNNNNNNSKKRIGGVCHLATWFGGSAVRAALFCGGPLNSNNKSISSSRDKRDRRRLFQNRRNNEKKKRKAKNIQIRRWWLIFLFVAPVGEEWTFFDVLEGNISCWRTHFLDTGKSICLVTVLLWLTAIYKWPLRKRWNVTKET